MEYIKVIQRIRKVIGSCKTVDQIKCAKKYATLYRRKHTRSYFTHSGEDISGYFLMRRKDQELNKWIDSLIKEQRTKIIFKRVHKIKVQEGF